MDEKRNFDSESEEDNYFLSDTTEHGTDSLSPKEYLSDEELEEEVEEEEEEEILPKKDSVPKRLANNAAEIKAALECIEDKKPVNLVHVVKQCSESYDELIKLTSTESSEPQASTSESAADTSESVANSEDTPLPKNPTIELSEHIEQLLAACKKVKDTYEKVTGVCNDVVTAYHNISKACPQLQDACVDIMSQCYHFAAFSLDVIPPTEQLQEAILKANVNYSPVISTVLDLSHSVNNMTEVCQQLSIESQKFLLKYLKLPQNRNFKQDAVSKEIDTARNKLEMIIYELELSGENLEIVTHDLENCLMKTTTAKDSPDSASRFSQTRGISAMRQLSSLCRAIRILFRRTSNEYTLPHV